MAKDFRANQTRTHKIIGSGSNVSGGIPSILVYSASSATDFDGSYETNMLASVGSDVFLFVSGAQDGTGKTAFGGDVVISGTLYAETIVVEVEETTTGSLSVSGSLFVSQSATINEGATINASQETGTENNFNVFAGSTRAIFVQADGTDIDITTNAGTSETITITNTQGTANAAIKLDARAGGVDIDAAAGEDVAIAGGQVAILSKDNVANAITLNTTICTTETITIQNDLGTSASAIKINSVAGGVDIDAAAGKIVNTGGGKIQFFPKDNAASAFYVSTDNGTSETVALENIQGTSESAIQFAAQSGGVDIDAAAGKNVAIDGGQVILTSKDDATNAIELITNIGSSETITIQNIQGTAAEAVQLYANNGGILIRSEAADKKLHMQTDGADADAIHLDAASGGIDIDSGTGIDISTTDLIITGTVEVSIGNAVISPAFSGSLTHLSDGTSYLVAGTDIAITTGSNGAVTIASTGGGGGTPSAPDTSVQFNNGGSFGGNSNFIFDDTNSRLFIKHVAVNEYVTASLFTQFAGDAFQFVGAAGAENEATDIAFYVSGSKVGIGVDLDPIISDAAVMGGDLVVSGAIFGRTGTGDNRTLNLVGGETLRGGNGSINAYVKGQNAFNVGTYEQPGFPAGTDVFFSVSGSIDGKIAGTGVAVIGGDLVVSGAIYGGNTGFADELLLFGDSISLGDTEPGQDTFLYVSGAVGGKQTGEGVTVFGGDTIFSGTIFNPGMSADTGGSAVKFGSFNELFYETSDARIKTDINTIDAGLHKVQNLRGVTFRNSQREDSETEVGLIAQEVQAVVPEIVTTTPSGYLQVDYAKMVAVLIEAVKEQQSTIQALENRILALEEK